MSTNNTGVMTAVACALASALTLGTALAPAFAATPVAPTPVVACANASGTTESEATEIALSFLGITKDQAHDIDCELIAWKGGISWDVEVETKAFEADRHVIVDATDGTIHDWWSN